MHPPNTKKNTILTNYTIYNTNMIHKLLHHHLKIAINMIHDYMYICIGSGCCQQLTGSPLLYQLFHLVHVEERQQQMTLDMDEISGKNVL